MDTALIKIDELLNKVNRISNIIEERHELLVNKFTLPNSMKEIESLNNYQSLAEKSEIRYTFKNNRTGYTSHFQLVQEYLLNRDGKFDPILLRLINLKVKCVSNSSRYAGLMSHGGTMTIQIHGETGGNWTRNVIAHELGHAWSMQLPKHAKLDSEVMMMDTIKYYLISIGALPATSKIREFGYLRKLVWKHISFYGGLNVWEAFAELFMQVYEGSNNKNFDIYWGKKAIERFNNSISIALHQM